MHWLKLKDDQLSLKNTSILIAIAYAFSVGFRLFLANYTSIAALKSDGQFINTPDGFYWAKGALDVLNNVAHPVMGSTYDATISQLTAFLTRMLPFSFETVIFFMPAIFGSLMVIPLIWIGHTIKQTYLGFLAALLGSVANSYYVRTQTGYFDTDMLTVVMPMLLVATIIAAISEQKKHLWFVVTAIIIFSQTWYGQSYAINIAILASFLGYTIIFDRKNIFNYQTAFYIALGAIHLPGFISFPILFKIIVALGFWALFHYRPKQAWPIFCTVSIIGGLYFCIAGGLEPILGLLKMYLVKTVENNSNTLQYFNVIKTIKEAGQIPFLTVAVRISGNEITFILACIGYVLAMIAYRPLLLTIPVAGLGFFAIIGGLRFTIYACPVMALGLAYLFIIISQKTKLNPYKYASATLMMILALFMNYLHINVMGYGSVLNKQEIETLNQASKKINSNDWVVSWWDYGPPFRYYLNTFVPTDGGRHEGVDNFPIAYAFTSNNQTAAARMLRIAMEHQKNENENTTENNLGYIENYLQQNHLSNPENFLEALNKTDFKLPPKTTELYLILPYRMLSLINTINLFSNIDLKTGQQKHSSFFYFARNWQNENELITLPNGIKIDITKGIVYSGKTQVLLGSITITKYQHNQLVVNKSLINTNGKLNLFLMKDYNMIFLADNVLSNSVFVKLFVTEEFDPQLFEPVVMNPVMKIYKLKI